MLKKLFTSNPPDIQVDIHSHLLPGIDDGVRSFEESIEILKGFHALGYKKIITTPHISNEKFPNTPELIESVCEDLRQHLATAGLEIELECAAEYKVDEAFIQTLKEGKRVLTFGDNYILFETSFYSKPLIFNEALFEMKSRGLIPVFAHPERYHYLEQDLTWLKSLIDKGVKLQMNLMSLVGVYGKEAEKLAKRMLKESMISLVGSDIHRVRQWDNVQLSITKKIKGYSFINQQFL